MDDLISRQTAIEIIQNMYPGMPRVPWLRKEWQERYEPYIRVEKAIRKLPSAQPEQQASDEIYGMMKDYYFKHWNDNDDSWQGGFAKCMNLIPNTYERREDETD